MRAELSRGRAGREDGLSSDPERQIRLLIEFKAHPHPGIVRRAAEVVNAGVSGDTSSDGLARLDWSVPQGTSAVIVELGANDMLRGIKPQITHDALDAILKRLTARHITVLLCGMRAAPNLGTDYGKAFEAIYPDLAAKHGTLLYPFFLDGVAGNLKLTQPDGMHPNPQGVDVIVERILPKVEELVVRAGALPPS